jgi:uncharacterized membrane protein YeaQ/YmgE (transglycosylase-associated protein family)
MNGLANIVIGIFGAFVGAGILNTLGMPVPQAFTLYGFLLAIGGAVLLIFAMGLIRR